MDRVLSFFKEVWLFISSRIFLINFAKLLGLLIVLFIMTTWGLNCYTNHGESVQVDDFMGMHLSDAKRNGSNKGFRFEVIDSVWKEGNPSGLITNQDPKPLSRVKEGRMIYVTVTGKPKTALLPLFSESSYDFDQYSRRLELRHKIKSRVKERVYDRKQANNTIKYLFDGDKKVTESDIKRGYKVQEGSTLDFVVTERKTNKMNIPDLKCMGFDAADFLVSTYNLNIGQIIEDATVTDRNTAYVYKQDPPYDELGTIKMGAQINLWLTQDLPADCE
ncbi:MAG TPA: PASTA domain-containing protein [Bacteroidetes bacterium]|nr:PASTA domain-containing protein [Bacteroidota bacterium]